MTAYDGKGRNRILSHGLPFAEENQILCWMVLTESIMCDCLDKDSLSRQLSPLGKKEKLHSLGNTHTETALSNTKCEIPQVCFRHRFIATDVTKCCVNTFIRTILMKTRRGIPSFHHRECTFGHFHSSAFVRGQNPSRQHQQRHTGAQHTHTALHDRYQSKRRSSDI